MDVCQPRHRHLPACCLVPLSENFLCCQNYRDQHSWEASQSLAWPALGVLWQLTQAVFSSSSPSNGPVGMQECKWTRSCCMSHAGIAQHQKNAAQFSRHAVCNAVPQARLQQPDQTLAADYFLEIFWASHLLQEFLVPTAATAMLVMSCFYNQADRMLCNTCVPCGTRSCPPCHMLTPACSMLSPAGEVRVTQNVWLCCWGLCRV